MISTTWGFARRGLVVSLLGVGVSEGGSCVAYEEVAEEVGGGGEGSALGADFERQDLRGVDPDGGHPAWGQECVS